jgi:hypothetical protein
MKCSVGWALPAVLSRLGPGSSRSGRNMFQRVVWGIYTAIALRGGLLRSRRLNMKCSTGRSLPAVLSPRGPGSSRSGRNMLQRVVWGIYTAIALQGGPLRSRRLTMKCSVGWALPAILSRLGPGSSRSGRNMFERWPLTKYGSCGYDQCIHGCSSVGSPDTALTA